MLKISLTLVDGQYDGSADGGGGEYNYVYHDPDLDQDPQTSFGGNRLVGARAARMKTEVPFIVFIDLREDFPLTKYLPVDLTSMTRSSEK